MTKVGIFLQLVAVIRGTEHLFFAVGTSAFMSCWVSEGICTPPDGIQLLLQSRNSSSKGCIAGGESCITLHQISQCFYLRRESIGQGVEVSVKLLNRKLRHPSPFCAFLFEGTMRPKLVLSALGGLFRLLCHTGLAVDGFPPGPVPIRTGQFLPYLIITGETIGMQHGVGCEEEKSGVHDQVSRLVGLLLGILEFVDVLGETLHVLMLRLHLILEIQNVCGMEANTHGLEVVQQGLRHDGRVE